MQIYIFLFKKTSFLRKILHSVTIHHSAPAAGRQIQQPAAAALKQTKPEGTSKTLPLPYRKHKWESEQQECVSLSKRPSFSL